jgi:quercetin dioxygenase-like cupin family protein
MPSTGQPQHEFVSVDDLAPIALMDGIRVRAVDGERITLAVFELEPGMRMPEHRHPNEQVGVVLRGEFTFTIGGETRLRRPGDMWVIPAEVPHTVADTGPDGCTIV